MSIAEFLRRPNLARFPFLFIVTYGRSGSTLLQGILNSVPGYCIRGENYSTLFYLFVASEHLGEAHRTFGRQESDAAASWFGADRLDPKAFSERLADAFLDTCLQPGMDIRCVGFKEIRYLPSQIPDEMFPAYLDFLQVVFPGAGLVFNVRDAAATASSGWWQYRDPKLITSELISTAERFKSYAAGRRNCFLFSYDALLAEPKYCKTLFEFLGESFDSEALERVLAGATAMKCFAARTANLPALRAPSRRANHSASKRESSPTCAEVWRQKRQRMMNCLRRKPRWPSASRNSGRWCRREMRSC